MLSLADIREIAKYARTYIRKYAHTHTHIQKNSSRKRWGVRKGKKHQRTKRQRAKKEKKEENEKKGRKKERVAEEKGKRKREGDGGRGAWVLRRVGPHTNNTRST